MTDEEKKNSSDLFGEEVVKPLFGADDSVVGKTLFDNEFSDPGDAAYVKPLFGEPAEKETSLDDFREYDTLAENIDSPADEAVQPVAENTPVVPEAQPEPAVQPEPVVMEAPAPKRKLISGITTLHGDLKAMSLGELMKYARETVGMTLEDVYECTRINTKFLIAIESDQFDKLPSGAFPGVYIRTLCSFYQLDTSAKSIAQEKAAPFCTTSHPSDKIYESLPQDAMIINKDEQEKFRRWMLFAGIIFVALILLILTLVVTFSVKNNSSDTEVKTSPVTMESLEKLSVPQMPVKRKLNVPGNK